MPCSTRHSDFATCVGWISSDEAISVGDDHTIIHWKNGKEVKRTSLHQSFYATCLHCPKIRGTSIETVLLGSSDGKLHLFSLKSGRIEKSVDAHEGAVLSSKWSPDSSAIASGGEDGMVKVWSKGLLLRSTLSAQASSIYAIDWSTSSSGLNSLAFVSQGTIHVKPITPHSRAISWKGHEGVILALTWSSYIATAGEDRKYKLWDARGRCMYSSQLHEHPLSCVVWCSETLVVGSFNLIEVATKRGEKTSLQYLEGVNSLTNVHCSPDETCIAAATTSGRIIFANFSGRQIETKSHQVTLVSNSRLLIRSIDTGEEHELDTSPANITSFTASFGYIVAVTSKSQGFIYKLSSNVEHKFDLKSANVFAILQCDRSFATFDSSSVSLSLFSYDGKLIALNIKWLGAPSYESMVQRNLLSLSSDSVAAVDSTDARVIHWITLPSPGGKMSVSGNGSSGTSETIHSLEVTSVALSSRHSRLCAFVDVNGDLYLVKVNGGRMIKIHSAIESILWSESNSLLAGISQSKQLLLWLSPEVAFSDSDLINDCLVCVATLQGHALSLTTFSDTTIVILSGLVHLTCKINPICVLLDEYCESNNFKKAVNLCRLLPTDDSHTRALWSSLAGKSLQSHHLNIAEIAYHQLDSVHRVVYLHQIQQLTDNNARNGELALLAGEADQSESIFLQAAFILRVILLRLSLFKWDDAIELALKHREKHPQYLKLVLWKRKKYLQRLRCNEDKRLFIDHYEEIVDEDEMTEDLIQLMNNPYSKM